MPLWLSDSAHDFLSNMLLKDPSRRSTAAQLLKHPWLKSLGFRPPVDQVPSSVEVVEPVLPPRPPQPQVEPVVITEPTAAEEEHIVEEETIKAVLPGMESCSVGKVAWQQNNRHHYIMLDSDESHHKGILHVPILSVMYNGCLLFTCVLPVESSLVGTTCPFAVMKPRMAWMAY